MKKTLFLFTIGFLFFTSCKKSEDPLTQQVSIIPQGNVPANVVNSFNARYPGATEIEWHLIITGRNSTTEFEVEFNHSSQRHSSSFDDNGTETKHGISCTDGPVPQVVLTAFRATHPNDIVYEWKLNNGNWKAHFNRGTVKWEATYTPAGVLIKEEHY